MDSLQYDDKAPRTPSPPAPSPHHNTNYKPDIDPVRIFSQDEDQYQWAAPQQRPSLLQELYDSDSQGLSPEQHPSPPDMYVEPQDNWPPAPPSRSGHDYTLIRRATFPYARQERPDELAQYPPFLHHPDPHGPSSAGYDPMPLSAEPSALHAHHPDGGYSPPGYPAPQDAPYEGGVKLEGHEHQHHLAHYGRHGEYAPPPQQQQQFYGRPPMHQYAQHPAQMHAAMQQQQQHHLASMHHHAHGPHPHNGMHLGGGHNVGFPPHGLPVQHTDDAASKETQYLRRRCYNCHTTEPPSWRRSTLNPGKIVCNKCGLYERTHLRARPLRFDELRAGNKARKNGGKGVGAGGSPKALGKKVGGAVQRRSSVSSTGSSVQSGSGASDWDDAASVYSNTSAPNGPSSAFNSPAFSPHPPSLSLSSHSSSHSNSNSSQSSSPGRSGGGRDSLSRSPPLLAPMGSPHLLGSPPHSAGFLGGIGGSGFHSHPHSHSHAHNGNGGNGIRLPHAPDIPTLGGVHGSPHMLGAGIGGMRTKPRSNTTGGLGLGLQGAQQGQGYYNPPPHGLHHSSSNSSLHSSHSQHSPSLHPSPLASASNGNGNGDAEGGLYRRGSMPDMHLWGVGRVGDGRGEREGGAAGGCCVGARARREYPTPPHPTPPGRRRHPPKNNSSSSSPKYLLEKLHRRDTPLRSPPPPTPTDDAPHIIYTAPHFALGRRRLRFYPLPR
ncbi:hypothetical protein B0H16DRAFT_1417505 [Mycena metata]|uniref:GATA-type domain-containing protein n=1 Tax=Mycena metata TaxID=1033252 RepID=A0AAD7NE20_9AGAR|nr:hypothetical protein B0H16DRAFT_1417505 [Mycena metata]